jgi:hypothetical protein
MFCPRCGAEYRPGFTECADCLVPLVDRLPHDEGPAERDGSSGPPEARGATGQGSARTRPRPELELVTVFATGDPALVALAKSLLQSAAIEFMVRGEGIHNLFGIGALGAGGFNPITGPVEFLVAAEDADDARTLLEDLTTAETDDADGADDR